MVLGLLILEVGVLMLYAGWTGKSFTRLIVGDNQTQATRTSLTDNAPSSGAGTAPPPASSVPLPGPNTGGTAPVTPNPPIRGSHGGSGNQ